MYSRPGDSYTWIDGVTYTLSNNTATVLSVQQVEDVIVYELGFNHWIFLQEQMCKQPVILTLG